MKTAMKLFTAALGLVLFAGCGSSEEDKTDRSPPYIFGYR
jgi:outer membrane murein-binding lipoprotein Lpp